MQGKGAVEAACIAADYTVECIRGPREDEERRRSAAAKAVQGKGPSYATDVPVGGKEGHWYGVEFERQLGYLIERLK